MWGKFKWDMFVTSFIPLWLSIIVIDIWNIVVYVFDKWDSKRQFIDNFCSGATTNLPFSEQRKLMRTIEGNCLSDMGEDCPNAEVTEVQGEMRQKFAFLPICVLDTEYSYIGTNRVFWAYVRADMPQNPSYARSIDALPLIYADGYWSFLY